MKKLLLIGELNQTVSSMNKHLSNRFQTQICVADLEIVKGMRKVFQADMIVVCLIGIDNVDNSILDYLKEHYVGIPVLIVGTVVECHYYQKYYETEQFDYLARPTTLSNLMQKCLEMLHMEAQKEVVKETTKAKKRILLVDDSGILLRSMKLMLDKQYEVTVATDGMMAIEKAKKKKPDLIVLDYEMPKMDGRETLEKLREEEGLADIPVVFLTSVADEENVSAVLRLLPDGYLLKPIDQERLHNTIEGVLGNEI